MELGIEIVTGRTAALRFDEFPVQAHDALLDVITRATRKLEDLAKERAPKRTGKLAAEITSVVKETASSITGTVHVVGESSNDYAKAGALEYGAHGVAAVKAYSRHVNGIEQHMKAHDRKLNIKEYDFMRGALDEIEGGVLDEMREAVEKVAAV